ncbi:acetate--CoA ligase family protein, partial [Streptomyces sp. NPDC052127]|uniref:acetate--CoA ligase family protein n=1 Tax=Streptomyces sp. NPDC052127 TaxID=3155679 RepID=UPI0034301C12
AVSARSVVPQTSRAAMERGATPVDRGRLTHVLLALASLAADNSVAECEINPLRVLPDGDVVALDAVLLLRDPRDQGGSDDA